MVGRDNTYVDITIKAPFKIFDGTFRILYLQALPSRFHGYSSLCHSKKFPSCDTTRANHREGKMTRGANIYVQIDILVHNLSFSYRVITAGLRKENLVILDTKKSKKTQTAMQSRTEYQAGTEDEHTRPRQLNWLGFTYY